MASFATNVQVPALYGSDKVVYECSCGYLRPISKVYFCRHCLKLRCKNCLSHEVDSQYCQHCLEYIPTIDAKLKKNKCSSCFSCPCCSHTLSTKAIVSNVKSDTDASVVTPKKSFYLVCNFCKWTSRDANIADQSTGSGGWPDVPTPDGRRLDVLYEHYRVIAQKEKMEKEKKRINPRTGHALHLLDKYGISASLSPKVRAQFYAKMSMSVTSPTSPVGSVGDLKSPSNVPCDPAIAEDDQENYSLTGDFYEQDLDLNSVSTIEQRLAQVELQPEMRSKLYPMSHMLSVKRSLRCKECEHNLSKPEYNPSSIKFKILLAAYYHVPEIQIRALPVLVAGKTGTLEITIQNPSPYALHVTLEDSDDSDDGTNCDVSLPQVEMIIPPKDDTLDIDIDGSGTGKTNPTLESVMVTFRKGNKLGLALPVTLRHDVVGQHRIGFYLKHDFVNHVMLSPGSDKRETQVKFVSHKVAINLSSEQNL
ncbi:Dynactin subunit 4 [Halotydeus destructor]|nr:Dynactin subunit 4 [Halotydeus destructor]